MNQTQNTGKTKLSLSLFIGGILAAILGATNLIVSIVLFKDNLDYYVSMGYDSSEVMGQLFPSQLLPTIIEDVVLYGGIALLLIFASAAYQKLTQINTQDSETVEETTAEISTELIETVESEPEMLETEISADSDTAVDESETAEGNAELTEEAISEEK
ncbi:hypothetical protein Q5O14_03825 [Eubacteriaceae bacterium ES2]|nr:hypothetical protein Q5O14_03825 [Eubacteriaceae bacterium ES2]